jgi:hypothetical protein
MKNQESQTPAQLLRAAAEEERRLLRAECDAEEALIQAKRRLASVEIELNEVRKKFDRRQRDVDDAMVELNLRRQARAEGPARPLVAVEASTDALPANDGSARPEHGA